MPTFTELGYLDLEFRIFHGLLARAGTPEPTLHAPEAGIVEVLKDPALRATLEKLGWESAPTGVKAFAAFLDRDLPKLQPAAKAAGVRAD